MFAAFEDLEWKQTFVSVDKMKLDFWHPCPELFLRSSIAGYRILSSLCHSGLLFSINCGVKGIVLESQAWQKQTEILIRSHAELVNP